MSIKLYDFKFQALPGRYYCSTHPGKKLINQAPTFGTGVLQNPETSVDEFPPCEENLESIASHVKNATSATANKLIGGREIQINHNRRDYETLKNAQLVPFQ